MDRVDQIDLETESNDTWTYIWGNATFHTSKVYKALKGHMHTDRAFKWLWRSSCQPQHLVFFWLLMRDKVNTRGTLRRRNMYLDSYVCEMCILQKEETIFHLFIRCNFTGACWASIGINMPRHLKIIPLIKWLKRTLNVDFYMDIIILMSWSIWKEMNEWIFQEIDPSIARSRERFFSELTMVVHRARRGHAEAIQSWIQSRY